MYRFRERERERESFTATRLPKCLAMRWTANLMPNGGAMLVFFVKLEREKERKAGRMRREGILLL